MDNYILYLGIDLFIGFLFGIVIYRDAKYYVYKKNPLLWTLLAVFIPFGFIIYLIFRKSHIPK